MIKKAQQNLLSHTRNLATIKTRKIRTLLFIIIVFSSVVGYSQNIPDSIYHDGLFRTYQTHLPSLYNPILSYPLVFVLHGGGGNAEFMSAYTQFNLTADTGNFIVVYPEGIYTGINVGGQPGHEWADGRMVLLPDSLGIDDVDFFDKLIDSISLPNIVVFDFSTVTKYTYSNCMDSVETFFYKIINGGHTWPQENDTLHVPFTGITNKDINGSNEIWNFFKNHCKKETTKQKLILVPW